MYVYRQSEPQLWTVGFYKPDGKWEPDSDHESRDEARKQVSYLNGNNIGEQQMLLMCQKDFLDFLDKENHRHHQILKEAQKVYKRRMREQEEGES